MTVARAVRERQIGEVLHFTTNKGLLGILASRAIKARSRLESDKMLEFILLRNAAFRKDQAWLDYVNLSISRINSQFFSASGLWHRHRQVWWCVLSLDPVILTHPGVVFATTNNIYPSAERGEGGTSLLRLFSPQVVGRYGSLIRRRDGMPDCYTTCEQAEVLYPGEVSTEYLRTIYVVQHDDADDVHGQIEAVGHRRVDVVVHPGKFSSVS